MLKLKKAGVADLRDFGGYTENPLNDSASVLKLAIAQLVAAGGGRLVIPRKEFSVASPVQTAVDGVNPNAQLVIPLRTALQDGITLEIVGESSPMTNAKGLQNPRIISRIQGTVVGGVVPALLGSSWTLTALQGNLNFIRVHLENLHLRTETMSGAAHIAGTMSAINFDVLSQFTYRNLFVDITSPLDFSLEPTNPTYGIRMPKIMNNALLGGGPVAVRGYFVGHTVDEHLNTEEMSIFGCCHALQIRDGYHCARIGRLSAELNQANILVSGGNSIYTDAALRLVIDAYTTERHNYGTGKWYQPVKDIKYNAGSAFIHIGASRVLSVNGGTNIYPDDSLFVADAPSGYQYTVDHGAGKTSADAGGETLLVDTSFDDDTDFGSGNTGVYKGWTFGCAPGNYVVINNDEGVRKLLCTNSGGGYAQASRALTGYNIGDTLHIIIDGVTVLGGATKFTLGSGSAQEGSHTFTAGTNDFTINTTGHTAKFAIINGFSSGTPAVRVKRIRIYKV